MIVLIFRQIIFMTLNITNYQYHEKFNSKIHF